MPEIQIPSVVILGLQVVLAFAGAFTLALWLSLIVWTFRDARSRSRDVFAVLLATLMVVLFGPLGLLLYFLLRPPITLAELYERSLEEEALLQDLEEQLRCPGCSRVVEDDWLVCPDCHTQLKKQCHECERLLNLRWNVCPYCGTKQTGGVIDLRKTGAAIAAPAPAAVTASPPDPMPEPASLRRPKPIDPPEPPTQRPEGSMSPTRPVPVSSVSTDEAARAFASSEVEPSLEAESSVPEAADSESKSS